MLSNNLRRVSKAGVDVADVFSTDLYTGTNSTQTITNGINLLEEGGLVWSKSRSNTQSSILRDTIDTGKYLTSNSDFFALSNAALLTPLSNGFSFGPNDLVTTNTWEYVAWTFRQAPKFFDIVRYVGNDAQRTINHSLSVEPSLVLIKRLDSPNQDWYAYFKPLGVNRYFKLNKPGQVFSGNSPSVPLFTNFWSFDSSSFYLGDSSTALNSGGINYVAYLFAEDTSDSGIIKSGVYVGQGSITPVTLGWEPQFVLVRPDGSTLLPDNWYVMDNVRGILPEANDKYLLIDTAWPEYEGPLISTNPTGFTVGGSLVQNNISYYYLAIRKEGV